MGDNDKTYQVVGDCAYATAPNALGVGKTLLYKGAMVSPDAPELEHLLATGLVVEVGAEETGGVNADGNAAGELDSDGNKRVLAPADDVDARRNAAREKLAGLGGKAPDGRQSPDVLVEYLVAKGFDYAELSKQDKATLLDMVRQQQSS